MDAWLLADHKSVLVLICLLSLPYTIYIGAFGKSLSVFLFFLVFFIEDTPQPAYPLQVIGMNRGILLP